METKIKTAAMLQAEGRCVNCYSKLYENMIHCHLADEEAMEAKIKTEAMLQAKGRCVK